MKEETLWQLCEREYFPKRLAIRSELTIKQYRFAVEDLGRFLERPARLTDLTDDNLCGMARMLLVDRGLAPKTVNERVGRIKTLWTWLARRGHLSLFPTFERIPEPRRDPCAWTEDELRRIFAAVASETLPVGPIPGPLWWKAWLATAWNTAERVSAIMSLRWSQLDWASGTIHVPAELRKQQTRDMTYALWPETLATLREIEQPYRPRIFPWPYCWPHTFYNRYWRIIARAGLQRHRRSGPHKMRVSHATWCKVLSGRHASNLGHASSQTTERHYEDPRVCRPPVPKLFVPWEDAG